MSGTYKSGESKIRPGSYYRYVTDAQLKSAGARDGVVAAVFSSSWGPLNQPVKMTSLRELNNVFGESGNTDAVKYALQGGAAAVLGIRLGEGGSRESATLLDTQQESPVQVVTLMARYVGKPGLSITIRDGIADETKKEALVYAKGAVVAKISFAKGENEPKAFADALNAAETVVMASCDAMGNGELALVSQQPFGEGEDPEITVEDYSAALEILETERWDVLIVDTDDAVVHALAQAYIERVVEEGLLGIAVLGGPVSLPYQTRVARAQAFDSANIVYVLNGGYDQQNTLIDGYRAAALVGGMVASIPSSDALTHKAAPGLVSLAGALTNAQIEDCITRGALIFTLSQSGNVWVESGVNTLNNLAANQDAGWKKIRRTKTRYELISRINESVEPLIGSISNNDDGRATVISLAQGVINDMIAENKLVSGVILEDETNPPEGDSAWFALDVKDLDSIEKVYLLYNFSFSG